jgi:imidazole glycerol phosphate synthase subunit HisF
MTLARRICAVVPCDDAGKPRRPFTKGGLDVDFIEAIAHHLANDGADEVWLRVDSSTTVGMHSSVGRGPNALFSPLSVLEKRTFVPVVAWAAAPTPADARLLLGFGADRVVVDAHLGLPDPLGFIGRVAQTAGADRVVAALAVRRFVSDKGIGWELVDTHGNGTGIDAITLAARLPATGACEILLVPSVQAPQSERFIHDGELIEKVSAMSNVPVLSVGEDRDLADVAAPLLMGADGVVTSLFASGSPTITAGKLALAEYGLPLRPATT